MFTETLAPRLAQRVLRSPLLNLLTGPHGVDAYTELLDPAWTEREARATVLAVRRQTPRSITLTLQPNPLGEQLFATFRAGQYVPVTVEVDGRRHTRCYSPANAEGAGLIELTVGRHDGGTVSEFLYRSAQPGMVVGLGAPAGDFTLDFTPTTTTRAVCSWCPAAAASHPSCRCCAPCRVAASRERSRSCTTRVDRRTSATAVNSTPPGGCGCCAATPAVAG